MDAFEPTEEKSVRRWRLSHGAVFLVIVLLGLTVAGFVMFDGWYFAQTLSVLEAADAPHE